MDKRQFLAGAAAQNGVQAEQDHAGNHRKEQNFEILSVRHCP